MSPNRLLIFGLSGLLLFFSWPGFALAQRFHEEEVKAAFLYQFTKFVEWPSNHEVDGGKFNLCVAGDNPLEGTLGRLEGASVKEKIIEVRYAHDWRFLEGCHMLYVSPSERDQMFSILRRAAAEPILTVSEIHGFIEHGGMINFVREGRKIRFEVNQQSAEQSRLKVSSKLLQLAIRVIR